VVTTIVRDQIQRSAIQKEVALQLRANQVADKAVVRGYLIPGLMPHAAAASPIRATVNRRPTSLASALIMN